MAKDIIPNQPTPEARKNGFDVYVGLEVRRVAQELGATIFSEDRTAPTENYGIRNGNLGIHLEYDRETWPESGLPLSVTFGSRTFGRDIRSGYVLSGITRFEVVPEVGVVIDAAQAVYTADLATDLKFDPRPALATITPKATIVSWGSSATVRRPK